VYNKAEKLYSEGKYAEALVVLESSINSSSVSAKELLLAGECAALVGDTENAERIFAKNVELNAKDPEAYYNLGVFYSHCGRAEEAFSMYKKGYEIDPSYLYGAEALSRMMRTAGWFKQAEKVARDILKYHPNNVSAYKELGAILVSSGQAFDGVEIYQSGIKVDPNDLFVRTQMLMGMNYCTEYSQEDIYRESLEWGRAATPGKLACRLQSASCSGRKIRIGYVSGDFRRHSVSYFIEPVLFNHNRDEFEIYLYSYTAALDHVSDRIKGMVDHWRDMVRVPTDVECAQIIADDEIDILVDLGGHTYDGVKALAHKCAPIQATYLGYPNTTGLQNVDYRLTDSYADPDEQDAFYSEKLVRLPSGFLSFAPPEDVPDVAASPCVKNGYITFGSFNNYAKVNSECIDMWSKILQRVDGSKLFIKSKLFNEKEFCKVILDTFRSKGISSDRIMLCGHIQSLAGHLDAYRHVDIALDTYPYNGTTTTCEAVWMGVPVVSMYGEDHRSRVGLSILSQMGLSSFAAPTAREYMKQAIKLASDHEQLAVLRGSLRGVLAASSVCGAVTTTREIEAVYKSWVND